MPVHIGKLLLTYPHLSKFDYLTMAMKGVEVADGRLGGGDGKGAEVVDGGMDGGDGKGAEVRDVT